MRNQNVTNSPSWPVSSLHHHKVRTGDGWGKAWPRSLLLLQKEPLVSKYSHWVLDEPHITASPLPLTHPACSRSEMTCGRRIKRTLIIEGSWSSLKWSHPCCLPNAWEILMPLHISSSATLYSHVVSRHTVSRASLHRNKVKGSCWKKSWEMRGFN